MISEVAAEIEMELSEKFHHAAGGDHGSVYFKMLEDAAWYAPKIAYNVFSKHDGQIK